MHKHTPEQQLLLEQIKQIAEGIGRTFAPFCEVVVHDLLTPQNAVLAIHNNLSGREEGHPATELGFSRIADPGYPQVIANYPNTFADGRQVKSTSVGVKDSQGRYIAALCLNVDLSLFQGLRHVLDQFSALDAPEDAGTRDSLDPTGAEAIRSHIDSFAARLSTTPRALKAEDKRLLLRELKESGRLERRRAMETVAGHLGISRATVYNYLK